MIESPGNREAKYPKGFLGPEYFPCHGFIRPNSRQFRHRVVFLGIDGVPYDLIERHPDVFPNLTAIAEEGSGGQISSIVPPESSACWPSLTTGKNPGQTGVYGFQDRKSDSYETYVPMGSHVQADRIWDLVTANGRNTSVFNVPVTFPPSPRIQRHVSGFLSPSVEDATSSTELQQTLENLDYRIDVNAQLGHDDDKQAFIDNARKTLEARYKTFVQYLAQDDWDLFFGVFMTTDRVIDLLHGLQAVGSHHGISASLLLRV